MASLKKEIKGLHEGKMLIPLIIMMVSAVICAILRGIVYAPIEEDNNFHLLGLFAIPLLLISVIRETHKKGTLHWAWYVLILLLLGAIYLLIAWIFRDYLSILFFVLVLINYCALAFICFGLILLLIAAVNHGEDILAVSKKWAIAEIVICLCVGSFAIYKADGFDAEAYLRQPDENGPEGGYWEGGEAYRAGRYADYEESPEPDYVEPYRIMSYCEAGNKYIKKENYDIGYLLWRKGSREGYGDCSYELGEMYHYGKFGKNRNYRKAVRYYRKAIHAQKSPVIRQSEIELSKLNTIGY